MNLANAGACCSSRALISGGNSICDARTTNDYAVGSAFVDLNKTKQQDANEKGTNIQDGALSVYAVDTTGHIVGSAFVETDGYWRIENGLQANSVYVRIEQLAEAVGGNVESAADPSARRLDDGRKSQSAVRIRGLD